MNHHIFVSGLCLATGLLGGLLFFVGSFTASTREEPHWVRMALRLSGFFFIAWSLLGFLLLLESDALSKITVLCIHNIKVLIGGMGVGILVLLFVSGECTKFSRRKTPPDL